MGKSKYVTLSYSCLQASFWMSLCVFMGFAAVYLQWLGYSNTELGIVMACGTLLGSVIGPEMSSIIDRSTTDRITASSMMPPLLAAEAAAIIVLLLFPVKGITTSVAFALFIALSTSVNSLDLKLYTDATYCGLYIDFGVARSMGSLGYVLISVVLGFLCEQISDRIVPAAGLALCAFQLISFLRFSRILKSAQQKNIFSGVAASDPSDNNAEQKPGVSISRFLIRNKSFSLILAGSILIFFSHNVLCNFFINVVRNVGGDTGDMGFMNGLMAFIEIPVIFFYSRLTKKFRTSSVLKAAFILFTAKAAAIAAADSVVTLACALIFQAPSFGLYTGAIVPYVDKVIAHEDSAKAQSLAFSVTMLGSVFASTIAGHLFDFMPVSSVMWIACAVCAAGSILAYLGVQNTYH